MKGGKSSNNANITEEQKKKIAEKKKLLAQKLKENLSRRKEAAKNS